MSAPRFFNGMSDQIDTLFTTPGPGTIKKTLFDDCPVPVAITFLRMLKGYS